MLIADLLIAEMRLVRGAVAIDVSSQQTSLFFFPLRHEWTEIHVYKAAKFLGEHLNNHTFSV
jgi:hypothetical protein